MIRRISRENRFWGAPPIQLELQHLGYEVAESTVDKYMTRYMGPPSPTWRAFLKNQADEILVCDFFTIPTATFRSLTGFVVMQLGQRRIMQCDVTMNPTAAWAAEVVPRASIAGGRTAQHLLRDRDAIYGAEFRNAVKEIGLRPVVTAYKAPRMNAHCERLIGTLRRECLDHMIVKGEDHARRMLSEFATYYNEGRTHQSLSGDTPVGREPEPRGCGQVVATPHLGGLHHSYRRVA